MKFLPLSDFSQLLNELLELRADIVARADSRLASIAYQWPAPDREYSAVNLSRYLAFRHHDIRPLQERLARAGLSSLGRGESNILNNIDVVIKILASVTGRDRQTNPENSVSKFELNGRGLLDTRNNALFGQSRKAYTRIMVTMSGEDAENYSLINDLISSGMDCARINCAHDTASDWERMAMHIREANTVVGAECKIFMDLSGMKFRTMHMAQTVENQGMEKIRLFEGDVVDLRCDMKSSVPSTTNPKSGRRKPAVIACSSDLFLSGVKPGQDVWIDDGKLGAKIEKVMKHGVRMRVTVAGPKGVSIKGDRGINFPDTRLNIPALTEKDLADLDFICRHADIAGMSFVQSAADLERVVAEVNKRRSGMPVVAKIETRRAVENLPDILFKGLSYPGPFAIMIARGDLAVELGSVRMSEIQEEILWLCEAAHLPVIWATQVLESLAKKGIISRPEITDAAMSVRAECVMLNKGKYIRNAVAILRDILDRMQKHQHKKISRLRALHW